MKISKLTLIAWGGVAAALVAWGLVLMFAWTISSQASEHSLLAGDSEAVLAREIASLRLHALARDTKEAREQLDLLATSEIVEIADIIERVGLATGAKVKISGANPEPAQQPNAKNPPLHAINFLVETEGSFSTLMHTVALLEALPVLSSIQNLEFERVQNSGGSAKDKSALWRLNANVKVMTTAAI